MCLKWQPKANNPNQNPHRRTDQWAKHTTHQNAETSPPLLNQYLYGDPGMTLVWRRKWLRTRSSPEAQWRRKTQGLRWSCGHQYRQGGRLLWWWQTRRFPIPTTIRKAINHIVQITTVEKRDQVTLLARLVDDSMKIRDIAIIGPISLLGISKELGGRFENTTYHLINMFPKFATYAPLMGTISSYSSVVFSRLEAHQPHPV